MKKYGIVFSILVLASCNTTTGEFENDRITNKDLASSYGGLLYCVDQRYRSERSGGIESKVRASVDQYDANLTER